MATTTTQIRRFTVGVLVFEGVDILDFAGPIEIFSHVSVTKNPDNPDRIYKCLTIGRTSTIRAADSLSVVTDMRIEDALRDPAQFDILVVPGGPPIVLAPLLAPSGPEMHLITAFAGLPPRIQSAECDGTPPRILFSVCVGAFLLGAAGILDGLHVTTHHRGIDRLGAICKAIEKVPASITEKRFVDGGLSRYGEGAVSVITAGGISSGLDGTLYIVKQQVSQDMADFIQRVMEYRSQQEV